MFTFFFRTLALYSENKRRKKTYNTAKPDRKNANTRQGKPHEVDPEGVVRVQGIGIGKVTSTTWRPSRQRRSARVPPFAFQTLRVLASDGLWSDPEDREKKRKRGSQGGGGNSVEREEEEEDVVGSGKARSVMIFVSKCRR